MNVTIICDVLGEPNNGTTIATLNLIHYLTDKGHRVKIVSADADTTGKENYYTVPALNLGPFNAALKRNGVRLAKSDKKILTQAIEDADVVHIQFPFSLGAAGAKLAKRMNKPVTASFHCQAENVTSHIGMMNVPFANRLTYKVFYRNVFRYCDKIHYPTAFIKDVFERETAPTAGEVISNGVNDAFFETRPHKRVSEKFTILCTGRYSREKAQHILIKAAAKSAHKEDIKLIFAGDGPYKKRLKKSAQKAGVDCEFKLFSRQELLEVLHGADLYVHTALVEIEAIACMEAIAGGLVPVICNSERSATRYFALDERNLFKKNDAQDLAAKIDFWYDNESLRNEYTQKYRALRDSFSQKVCMEQMEQMLLNAIEEHKKVS